MLRTSTDVRGIVLRSGEDSATLTNQGPARPARDPALAQAAPTDTEVK